MQWWAGRRELASDVARERAQADALKCSYAILEVAGLKDGVGHEPGMNCLSVLRAHDIEGQVERVGEQLQAWHRKRRGPGQLMRFWSNAGSWGRAGQRVCHGCVRQRV